MKFAAVVVGALLVGAAPASAQSVGDAVLALWNGVPDAPVQSVSGRIYGSTVDATVINVDGVGSKLGADDLVPAFSISRNGRSLVFPADDPSRAAFNRWVDANAAAILALLFPASLSESVTGRDTAQTYAQQFLLTTALDITEVRRGNAAARGAAAGLFEFEQMDTPGQTGHAWQGLYRLEGIHMGLQGRVTEQHENVGLLRQTSTQSFSVGADYHPSVELDTPLPVRIGVNARYGVLYAHGDTLDFGSLDFGGGAWSSVQKDFDRIRVAGAGMLQASKSYLPTGFIADEMRMLADAVNERGIAWDASYGVVGGYALTRRTSLNGKFLHTVPLGSPSVEDRPAPWLVIGGVSYLVGGHTPVDVGYKLSRARGLDAHSVFVQGHFGF